MPSYIIAPPCPIVSAIQCGISYHAIVETKVAAEADVVWNLPSCEAVHPHEQDPQKAERDVHKIAGDVVERHEAEGRAHAHFVVVADRVIEVLVLIDNEFHRGNNIVDCGNE